MVTTTYQPHPEIYRSSQQQESDPSLRSVLLVAVRYTLVTTVLVGIVYPLFITAIAQITMPSRANGQLIVRNGAVIGSAIIGQQFKGSSYFHSRPSAAGSGYDAANSGGSNLAPSNSQLIQRVEQDLSAWHQRDAEAQGPVPIGLVTTSASGFDPDISPEDAYYQVPMVAAARHLPQSTIRALVASRVEGRQLGFLGEPRINVLKLNMALDDLQAASRGKSSQ
jgi:K+-transporting ATPase ATPase C chain